MYYVIASSFTYVFFLENDIVLRKRISNELGLEVDQAAAGNRVNTIKILSNDTIIEYLDIKGNLNKCFLKFQDDYDVFKFPASSINNMLYAILIATSTLALLVLSTAIIVLTKHCVRRRRETKAMNKLQNQDNLEAERGKVQEEYKVTYKFSSNIAFIVFIYFVI